MLMTEADTLCEYLLRFGDNCLILGHRLSEWVGHGPVLEEELALANIGLDLLGQAQYWLNLAGEIEGQGHDADFFAYKRDAGAFRNVLLVEQANGDFALTMARQAYFDSWHFLILEQLCRSRHQRIGEIAAKALKEVRYHVERSSDWLIRLGDGTEESHRRMQNAIDDLWIFTGELFDMDAVDEVLLAQGIAVDFNLILPQWRQRLQAVLDEATLTVPETGWMRRGGKQGVHSEHLGYLLAEMQFLPRAYPDAHW